MLDFIKNYPWKNFLLGSLSVTLFAMATSTSMVLPVLEIALTVGISAGYVLAAHAIFSLGRMAWNYWNPQPVAPAPLTPEEILEHGKLIGRENGFRNGHQSGLELGINRGFERGQADAYEKADKNIADIVTAHNKMVEAIQSQHLSEIDRISQEHEQLCNQAYAAGVEEGRKQAVVETPVTIIPFCPAPGTDDFDDFTYEPGPDHEENSGPSEEPTTLPTTTPALPLEEAPVAPTPILNGYSHARRQNWLDNRVKPIQNMLGSISIENGEGEVVRRASARLANKNN